MVLASTVGPWVDPLFISGKDMWGLKFENLCDACLRFCIHYRTFGGSFLLHVPYSHGIAPSNSASTEISIRAWDWKAVNDSSRLNVVYCSNFQIQIQIHLHTMMILFPFLNCILRTCASLHLLSFSFCLGCPGMAMVICQLAWNTENICLCSIHLRVVKYS